MSEKSNKKNNKTYLNALIGIIAAIIALLSIISFVFSNLESGCNNDVQNMLINKTQQYVEKQETLTTLASDISQRAAYIVKGDNNLIEGFTERIRSDNSEYKSFKDYMKNYDSNISSKKDSCRTPSIIVSILTVVIIILATIQVAVSQRYLNKYK